MSEISAGSMLPLLSHRDDDTKLAASYDSASGADQAGHPNIIHRADSAPYSVGLGPSSSVRRNVPPGIPSHDVDDDTSSVSSGSPSLDEVIDVQPSGPSRHGYVRSSRANPSSSGYALLNSDHDSSLNHPHTGGRESKNPVISSLSVSRAQQQQQQAQQQLQQQFVPRTPPLGGSPFGGRRKAAKEKQKESPCAWMNLPLFLAGCCVVVCSGGEQILRKVASSNMYNYRWFLVQLFSLLSLAICLPPAIAHGRKFTASQWKRLPYRFMLWIAFLDSWHTMLLFVSVAVVPGVVSVMVPQLFLPLCMLFFNYYPVKRDEEVFGPEPAPFRHKLVWWISGLAVLGGILFTFIPDIILFKECSLGEGFSQTQYAANAVILFLAVIPGVLSHLHKQYQFERHHMHIWFLNASTSLFQLIFGFILSPLILHLQYINTPLQADEDQPINFSHTFSNFAAGFKCLFGTNSEQYDTCQTDSPTAGIAVLLLVIATIGLQVAVRQLGQRVSHPSGVDVCITGGTVFAFLFYAVPSPNVHHFLPGTPFGFCGDVSPFTIIGAVVAIAGLFGLRYYPEPVEDEIDVWDYLRDDEEPAPIPGMARQPSNL